MTGNHRTGVVILNWNGLEDTLACLASLMKADTSAMTILVVDNGSSDGSAGVIRRAFADIELLELPENLGFAGGCNAGFAYLDAKGIATVIFLNNDTVVDSAFPGSLVGALADPWIGIAVPKILYMDDPDRIWYAGGIVNPATGLIAHRGIRHLDGPAFSVSGPTGYATGCCLCIGAAAFRELGGFDERFRMYGEDVDLCLRMRERGLVIWFEASSRVWHRVSSTSGGEFRIAKQLRKSVAAVGIMRRHRMWGGMLLYPLLLPFRSLAALVRLGFLRRGR